MRTALLALLLAFPVQAAENDVVCDGKICMIHRATLMTLLEGVKQMGERQAQLERLCGWTQP